MERFVWFFEEMTTQIARLKSIVISLLKNIPYLDNLPESRLEWIFFGIVLVLAFFIAIPLMKMSAKIAVGAVALAAVLAYFTSYPFWGVLPFTGMGVAVVLFSNKFLMG